MHKNVPHIGSFRSRFLIFPAPGKKKQDQTKDQAPSFLQFTHIDPRQFSELLCCRESISLKLIVSNLFCELALTLSFTIGKSQELQCNSWLFPSCRRNWVLADALSQNADRLPAGLQRLLVRRAAVEGKPPVDKRLFDAEGPLLIRTARRMASSSKTVRSAHKPSFGQPSMINRREHRRFR